MNNLTVSTVAFQRYVPGRTSEYPKISVFPSSRRITLNRHADNEWTKNLISRFNELTALPVGWDGYGGKPVSFTCASFAANLLERLYDQDIPPPSLVPGSDGTIQFEWHINNFDIEVDVLGAFEVLASRHNCDTGDLEEIEIEADFTILAGWIGDLKSEPSQRMKFLAV